jgi:hypothetical protein
LGLCTMAGPIPMSENIASPCWKTLINATMPKISGKSSRVRMKLLTRRID